MAYFHCTLLPVSRAALVSAEAARTCVCVPSLDRKLLCTGQLTQVRFSAPPSLSAPAGMAVALPGPLAGRDGVQNSRQGLGRRRQGQLVQNLALAAGQTAGMNHTAQLVTDDDQAVTAEVAEQRFGGHALFAHRRVVGHRLPVTAFQDLVGLQREL